MLSRPRLKVFLTVFQLSESSWAIRGGGDEIWRLKLTDPEAFQALGALLAVLDGHATTAELIARLVADGHDAAKLQALLDHLEAGSFLEEAPTALHEPRPFEQQRAFFSRFTQDGGSSLQAKLEGSRLAVLGDGPLAAALLEIAASSGFGRLVQLSATPTESAELRAGREWVRLDREPIWAESELGPPPDLLLVAQQRHDEALLESVDAWSKRAGRPWLLVRHLDLREGWVGPLFVPGETASYRSLQARLAGNLTHFEEHQAFDRMVRANLEAKPPGALQAFLYTLAGMALTEVVKLVAGTHVPHLLSRFLTVDLWTWEVETHEVLRVPGLDRPPARQPAPFPWRSDEHDLKRTPSAG
jgi:bacteriocin biosynthesis cyclodehydratase domain-containing protein